jgi:photosystem II stability/assembly factor-like uncharacterized protein
MAATSRAAVYQVSPLTLSTLREGVMNRFRIIGRRVVTVAGLAGALLGLSAGPAPALGVPAAWAASAARPATAPVLAGLGGVSCPTAEVCFAIGGEAGFPQGKGVIIGTTDGGSRWNVLGQPAGPHIFYGITCPAALNCKVAGIGPSDAGTVYATRDGGTVWVKDPVELGSEPFLAVACHTPRTCEAGGSGVEPLMYGTSNGGKAWSSQSVPDLSMVDGLACPTASVCVASGYDGARISLPTAAIARTTDGGSRWTAQVVPGASANGVACPTARVCTAAGVAGTGAGRGEILRTANGGATWSRQDLPPGTPELLSVSCPSVSDCVAVGFGSASWATTDGGRTWTQQPVPAGVADLRNLSCPTVSICEAVGESPGNTAVALRTTDGGAKWSVQAVP